MGIINLVEEVAGAVAADKALEAVDSNAGFMAKAAAAVAGFEGVSKLKEHLEGSDDQGEQQADDSANATA